MEKKFFILFHFILLKKAYVLAIPHTFMYIRNIQKNT